jgi:hypothetical protein
VKTILAGSRSIGDMGCLHEAIRAAGFEITEVVCGEARGVDAMGRWWATQNKVPVASFPARWNEEGLRAGFTRNTRMARYADALIALWDGRSHGTAHMIAMAVALGLKVYVYLVPAFDETRKATADDPRKGER